MEKIFNPIYRHPIYSYGFNFEGNFTRCQNLIYRKTFYTISLFDERQSAYRNVALRPSAKEINMNDHTFMLKFNEQFIKFMDYLNCFSSDKKVKTIDSLIRHIKTHTTPESAINDEEVKSLVKNIFMNLQYEYNNVTKTGAFFVPKCFIMGQYIDHDSGNIYPVYYVLQNFKNISEWIKKEVKLIGNEILYIDKDGAIDVTPHVTSLEVSDIYKGNMDKWLFNFNTTSIFHSKKEVSEKEKIAYEFVMLSLIDMLKIENNNNMEYNHA